MKQFLNKLTFKQIYFPILAILLAVSFFLLALLVGCGRKVAETTIKGDDEKIFINQNENFELAIPSVKELLHEAEEAVVDASD